MFDVCNRRSYGESVTCTVAVLKNGCPSVVWRVIFSLVALSPIALARIISGTLKISNKSLSHKAWIAIRFLERLTVSKELVEKLLRRLNH